MTDTLPGLSPELRRRLNTLFSRSYYSAAGYVFESQPYLVDTDLPVMNRLADVREDDRQHALLLAGLTEMYDLVPEPGAFPYWHRDLNYLTAPYMAGFVVESLEDDIALYKETISAFPEEMRVAHTALRTILREKETTLGELRAVAANAKAREAETYAEKIVAVKKARADRLAAEKAAKAAARKKKSAKPVKVTLDYDPTEGMPDPHEAGISMEENARRKIARLKAVKEAMAKAAAGVGAASSGPVYVDLSKYPDPAEPGISMEENAKRKIARLKALKDAGPGAIAGKPPAGVTAAAGGDDNFGLPDPNEKGISPKERAKRTMMIKRARKKAEAEGGAASPTSDPAAGMPDPNEPGISSKEKAKRTMMIKRAQKKAEAAGGAGAAAPASDPAAGMPDPDEPGISPKEKAKRTMMIKRARKKAEEG